MQSSYLTVSPSQHQWRTSLLSSDQHGASSQSDAGASLQAYAQLKEIDLDHAPPIVQGIQLVSPKELPDRFRSVFPFQLFNPVQSKCYEIVYKSSENLVLSAPTGSGKTAVLELAICQLISSLKSDQFKIVYMAPTKSLCSERQRDWQAKFASLDLQSAELTGDTDQPHLRNVQNASIIITTPEKWDSMTRKWKDHAKLMQLVKLFLIDEVHILKDRRGATLEAVVSRMKSVGSHVRFVALSATVPNSEDIATWLGRDPLRQHLPAQRQKLGDEFRPVKLQKFVYGLPYSGNDFGFEKVCDSKYTTKTLVLKPATANIAQTTTDYRKALAKQTYHDILHDKEVCNCHCKSACQSMGNKRCPRPPLARTDSKNCCARPRSER